MSPERQSQWNGVVDKRITHGLQALSKPEQVWFTVRSLVDSTENGGLISYFYNSGADDMPVCIEALQSLGCERVIELLEPVAALFPSHVDRLGVEGRNKVFDSWPDPNGENDRLLDRIDSALFDEFVQVEIELDEYLITHGFAA